MLIVSVFVPAFTQYYHYRYYYYPPLPIRPMLYMSVVTEVALIATVIRSRAVEQLHYNIKSTLAVIAVNALLGPPVQIGYRQ